MYATKTTDTAGNVSRNEWPTYVEAERHYQNRFAHRRAWNYRRVELIGTDGLPLQVWDAKLEAAFK